MSTSITANGINFPNGSAGTPSVAGSDTDTGLFYGTDIVGFATGGSERLRIDASGYVGIGNTSMGSYHSKNLVINSHDNGGITLVSAANEASGITFADGTGTPDKYTGFIQYDHSNNAITFGTNGGSERLRIDASGNINIANDSGKLQLGTGDDLKIYHNGTNSYIRNSTGILHVGGSSSGDLVLESGGDVRTVTWAGESMIEAKQNGAVELYYDNSKKFHTYSDGCSVFGHLNLEDNDRLRLGDSSDLQIYHDGSHSKITNATGHIVINSDSLDITNAADNETLAKFDHNGAVELYHDNVKQLETTRQGINLPKGVIQGVGNGSMAIIGGSMNPSNDLTWNFPFNTNHAGTNCGYFFYVRVFLNHWNTGDYFKVFEKYVGGRGNVTGMNSVTPINNVGTGSASWSNGHFETSVVLSGDGTLPATFKVTYDADGAPGYTSGYHICVQHSGNMGPPTIT